MKTITMTEFTTITDPKGNELTNGRAKIYYVSSFLIAFEGYPTTKYDTLEDAEAANANGDIIYMIVYTRGGIGDAVIILGYEIGEPDYNW